MSYFPFYMEVEGTSMLIVGGGKKAHFKIKKLLPYGILLKVIAPDIIDEIKRIPGIVAEEREFCEEDLLQPLKAVVVAIDEKEESRRIAGLCRERNILVNSVDDPEYCDFLFPSLIKRGKLTVGICSGGGAPGMSVVLREQIEELLPENMEEVLIWLEELRPSLLREFSEEGKRGNVIRRIYIECVQKKSILTEEEVRAICESEKD